MVTTMAHSTEASMKIQMSLRFRRITLAIFVISSFVTFADIPFSTAQDSDEAEAPTKIIKVSRRKLEDAAIQALVQSKATFHGIGRCGESCNRPEENRADGEIKYDKNGIPWTYRIPISRVGGLIAVVTAENNPIYLQQYFSIPLTDCREFFKKLRAARAPAFAGAAPYEIRFEYGLLAMGENRLDLLEPLCQAKREPGEGRSFTLSLQSIVGPFVNVMNWNTYTSEGARSSSANEWISWNLKENRRAELVDLFDEASVISALKADKVMQQRFFKGRRKQLEAVTEFAPLMQAIDKDPRQHRRRMGWQILSYNRKTKIANVHLGFYGNCCNSNKVFRMGLNLKVRPEYEKQFEVMKVIPWWWDTKEKRTPEKFERVFSTYGDPSLPYKEENW